MFWHEKVLAVIEEKLSGNVRIVDGRPELWRTDITDIIFA
jgi:hypothetical protein